MLLVFVIVFCAIVALGFGGAAAWSDYRSLTIPNMYAAFIGAAFIPAFLLVTLMTSDASIFASWKSHLFAVTFIFIVTYLLFYFKVIGGGDSKLLTVYALWAGLGGIMPLIFFMAVSGGILGVATLALRKWKPVKTPVNGSWIEKAQSGKQDVPYGIAIFIGAVASFWQVGYIRPEILAEIASGGIGL